MHTEQAVLHNISFVNVEVMRRVACEKSSGMANKAGAKLAVKKCDASVMLLGVKL